MKPFFDCIQSDLFNLVKNVSLKTKNRKISNHKKLKIIQSIKKWFGDLYLNTRCWSWSWWRCWFRCSWGWGRGIGWKFCRGRRLCWLGRMNGSHTASTISILRWHRSSHYITINHVFLGVSCTILVIKIKELTLRISRTIDLKITSIVSALTSIVKAMNTWHSVAETSNWNWLSM